MSASESAKIAKHYRLCICTVKALTALMYPLLATFLYSMVWLNGLFRVTLLSTVFWFGLFALQLLYLTFCKLSVFLILIFGH